MTITRCEALGDLGLEASPSEDGTSQSAPSVASGSWAIASRLSGVASRSARARVVMLMHTRRICAVCDQEHGDTRSVWSSTTCRAAATNASEEDRVASHGWGDDRHRDPGVRQRPWFPLIRGRSARGSRLARIRPRLRRNGIARTSRCLPIRGRARARRRPTRRRGSLQAEVHPADAIGRSS